MMSRLESLVLGVAAAGSLAIGCGDQGSQGRITAPGQEMVEEMYGMTENDAIKIVNYRLFLNPEGNDELWFIMYNGSGRIYNNVTAEIVMTDMSNRAYVFPSGIYNDPKFLDEYVKGEFFSPGTLLFSRFVFLPDTRRFFTSPGDNVHVKTGAGLPYSMISVGG
ncbi:hypothetical protein HYX09_05450 [Candidatus Woesearchaeota archaeon]|nr:hypothetical protein [Candidatus Woesearchaeota archaeon]